MPFLVARETRGALTSLARVWGANPFGGEADAGGSAGVGKGGVSGEGAAG